MFKVNNKDTKMTLLVYCLLTPVSFFVNFEHIYSKVNDSRLCHHQTKYPNLLVSFVPFVSTCFQDMGIFCRKLTHLNEKCFFFYQDFLSQALTIHRTLVKERGTSLFLSNFPPGHKHSFLFEQNHFKNIRSTNVYFYLFA